MHVEAVEQLVGVSFPFPTMCVLGIELRSSSTLNLCSISAAQNLLFSLQIIQLGIKLIINPPASASQVWGLQV